MPKFTSFLIKVIVTCRVSINMTANTVAHSANDWLSPVPTQLESPTEYLTIVSYFSRKFKDIIIGHIPYSRSALRYRVHQAAAVES